MILEFFLKRFISFVLCFILLDILPISAQNNDTKTIISGVILEGDTKKNLSNSNTNNIQKEPKAIDTLPIERIGIQTGKVIKLSIRDAILMALQNNIDLEIEGENTSIARYNLSGSKGSYDPIFGSSLNFNDAVIPTAQTFVGAQDGSYKVKQLNYNFNIKGLFNTGSSYSIDFNNNRQVNNAASAGLNPQYSTSLQFQFLQPLLRNFRSSQNEYSVKINRKRLEISDSIFKQRVTSVIANVQSAYWDLVYAVRNNQIAREAVELADVTLRNSQKQVEVGTLAPIEVISAKADLESRKDVAISALQQVTIAENALKALILGDPTTDTWTSEIDTTEQVEFTPINIDLHIAVEEAIKNRPEYEQLKLNSDIKDVDLRFFNNQKKPQIDFITSFSLSGLAGTANGLPSNITKNGLFNYLSIVPLQTPQFGISPRFIGGYGTALDNLFSTDFHNYSLGVNFEFPLRNRIAEANFGRTVAERRQLKAQEKQLRQSIEVEVRNALQSVVSAKQRVEAARAARIAAEAQLKGEEQKYTVGMSNNFLILDRQTRLSTARGQEIRAITDYNKGVTQLQRVMATTLNVNNIQIIPSEKNVLGITPKVGIK